ncbi:MAG: MotA/TolQ/ExbB proton channel family protein [Pseudomonadota bacterium]
MKNEFGESGNMIWLEDLMYRASGFFLTPVLLLLVLLFAYACYALGAFVMQAWQRKKTRGVYQVLIAANLVSENKQLPRGYPLVNLALELPHVSQDELDVAALKELEGVRSVSRLAPMLGLIATMIPMGPALKNLANGNIQGISENLIVAFSAVIFGLVISSVTFWIASVKKRWLAVELVDVINAIGNRQ